MVSFVVVGYTMFMVKSDWKMAENQKLQAEAAKM